ncbi:hypothetical protein NPIL_298601, partial [Nephila pilipes]
VLRNIFMENETVRNLEGFQCVDLSRCPFARSLPSSAAVRLYLVRQLRTKQSGTQATPIRSWRRHVIRGFERL